MLDEKPSAKENIYIEELEDGAMLHDEGRVHILNGTAFLVWLYCDGKTTVQRIVEAIKGAYKNNTVNQDDILKIIEDFKTKGLVV